MKSATGIKNQILKSERKRRGWSQAQVAKILGVTTKTVMRWEQGLTVPLSYYCEQLGILFGMTVQELSLFYDTDENRAVNTNKLVNTSEGLNAPPYCEGVCNPSQGFSNEERGHATLRTPKNPAYRQFFPKGTSNGTSTIDQLAKNKLELKQ